MSEFADGFDPIETARAIEESYRGYIASTIHFSNEGYQRQLEAILAQPGYLAKGPFLEGAPPYKADKSVRSIWARTLSKLPAPFTLWPISYCKMPKPKR